MVTPPLHMPFYDGSQRTLLCRLVFGWIIASLLYGLYSHTLTHQLQAPVLRHPYVDPTYWLFHLLQLPERITQNHWTAIVFDTALLALAILSFCYPRKRVFIGLFFIFYFTYFIIFNTYGAHHTGPKIGCLLMPVPFLVRNDKSFNYLWQSLRYFLLFSFGSAFAWKLLRGSWFHTDQGLLIMKKNLAGYLYFHPDTLLAIVSRWFLQHPAWLNGLFMLGIAMEGIFLIGFFTRRFDHLLVLIALLLMIGFRFMAHAFFFELFVLCFTLVDFSRLHFFKQGSQRPFEMLPVR